MKVLHVITGLGQGGAEAMLIKLLEEMKRSSACDQMVVSLTDSGVNGSKIRAIGITLKCLEMRQGNLPSLLKINKLRLIISQEKPDVVQTWLDHSDVFGGIASKWADKSIPVFWNLRHSSPSVIHRKLSRKLLGAVHRILVNPIPTQILVNSKCGLHAHADAGYPLAKMVHIPNAFDTVEFNPGHRLGDILRKRFGNVAENTVVFGMAARYAPMKDHDNLLKAIRLIIRGQPNLVFYLCGQGIDQNNAALANKIEEYRLNECVALLGPQDRMNEYMNSLDYFVLSSAHGEGFPNVIGEAMACGKPCISTDVGDAAEIIGSTGWIVPPKNPEALAAAMSEAAREDAGAKSCRQANCRQRIVDFYAISDIAASYLDIWRRALPATPT